MALNSHSVVTFNVLAPLLCDDNCWNNSLGHNDGELRFVRITEQIARECEKNSIIALQEVCRDWAGRFQVFFEQRGYVFIPTSTGNTWSEYMGVGLAFPREYELVDCKFASPFSDFKKAPKEPKTMSKYIPIMLGSLFTLGVNAFVKDSRHVTSGCLGALALGTYAAYRYDHRKPLGKFDVNRDLRDCVGHRSFDIVLMVKLQRDNQSFWVSTTHMPCKFWNEDLMVTYAALIVQKVQTIAGDEPYVLMGDFNARPDGKAYEVFSKGCVSNCSIEIEDWRPECNSMRSAYQSKNGSEPAFTNFAKTTRVEFKGTLDYIWLSRHFTIESVMDIPEIPEDCLSWPSATVPSDHCMIGADVVIL